MVTLFEIDWLVSMLNRRVDDIEFSESQRDQALKILKALEEERKPS